MTPDQETSILEFTATFLGGSIERGMNERLGEEDFSLSPAYAARQILVGKACFEMGLMIGIVKKEWGAVLLASEPDNNRRSFANLVSIVNSFQHDSEAFKAQFDGH